MTESGSRNEGATCGNCGAPVTAADVTCPSCGVLLAAYQAPTGSLGGDIPMSSGSEPIPASSTFPAEPLADMEVSTIPSVPGIPTLPAPAQHRPASLSPIDDALRQAHGEDVEAVALEFSAAAAGELAQMATSDSSLAHEVEAELAGARVTFDGANPVIVTNPDAAAPPTTVIEPPVTPPARQRPAPARVPVSPSGQAPQVRPQSNRSAQWLPLLVVVVLFLVVARAASSLGGVITLVLGVMLVLWLLRLTGASGRKTTWMPWDNSQDKSGRK